MRKVWPQQWVAYLTANYATKTNAEIAEYLGLSVTAVQLKAYRLGIRKPPVQTLGMTKEQRYTMRCVSQGLCPCCGQPAAPFYLCEYHREKERARAIGGKPRKCKAVPRRDIFVSSGIITKVKNVITHRIL